MDFTARKDIGFYLEPILAGATDTQVAGAVSPVVGESIEILGRESAQLQIVGQSTLAENETLGFTVTYETSTDGSSWSGATALVTLDAVLTGVTGGPEQNFAVGVNTNFYGVGDFYVRYNVTPVFSAGATDTATFTTVASAETGAERPTQITARV